VRRRLLGLALGIAACFTAASSAHAVDPPETPGPPETPSFGPDIEPLRDEPHYQATCTYPNVLEGTREFAELLVATYPGSSNGGYLRKCHEGVDPSEHKEGRAFDWMWTLLTRISTLRWMRCLPGCSPRTSMGMSMRCSDGSG